MLVDLIVAWLIFPLVLAAVALGCGLLVERASGRRLPGALLPSLGLALVIVFATLMVELDATGAAIPAAALALALSGYFAGRRRLGGARPDGWAAGLAAATFAVLAAPMVLTGESTFFFFLNDTAVQLVLLDWVPEHGREFAALEPSAYQATVSGYLSTAYPLGAHMGLAAVGPLVGADLAWTYQPYLAVVLTFGALVLYALLRPIASRRFSAFAAFLAIQPGLVYAYYLNGTIKELAMIWALLLTVALVWLTARERPTVRSMLPLALAVAAALAVLNLAALPWIGVPLAFFAVAVVWRNRGLPARRLVLPLFGAAAVAIALSIPALAMLGTFRSVTTAVLTNQTELGNLLGPISGWHLVGIWPSGDFRTSPDEHPALAFALMGVGLGALVLGGVWAVRRRAGGPLLLLAASLVAVAYLVRRGSPYADAKAMMVASSGVMLVATLGVLSLRSAGRRLEAVLLAAALAAGVLWTNALAYQNAQPAPRDRYAELRSIADRFAAENPALVTEYDPFLGYFLRPMRTTGALLRPDAPPRPGLRAKYPRDLDHVVPEYLEQLELVVMRRSPGNSRPPAGWSRAWSGEHYEVWRRGESAPRIHEHLPLGELDRPAARPPCDEVRSLAARADRRDAELAFVERPRMPTMRPSDAPLPAGWARHQGIDLVQPRGAGTLRAPIEISRPGDYLVWLQASMVRDLVVSIDGRPVATAEGQIGQPGQMLLAGRARIESGEHVVEVKLSSPSLAPGEDGFPRDRLGPLVLQPAEDDLEVQTVAPAEAEAKLCGRRLDWIEVVSR